MRDYIFRGKRVNNGEWVEGGIIPLDPDSGYIFIAEPYLYASTLPVYEIVKHHMHLVIPESVGQYTGMNEFIASDKSFNKPLFEGDVVEVWSNRSPKYTRVAKSQYDGDVVVRATICFRHGSWTLDYDNKYNEAIAKLRGKEEDERAVDGDWDLYHYGLCYGNEEWLRKHNFKWRDIKKIGTVFDNADLLEG